MSAKRKPPPKPAKRPATPADWHGASKTFAIDQSDRLKLHVRFNPKKRGSPEAAAFALYHDGMTVAAYLKAGGSREALAHDRARGYVTLHDAAVYARLRAAGASPAARSVTLMMRKTADAHQEATTAA